MPAHKIPENIKEKGLKKLLPPYSWSLRRVSSELGVGASTVWKWRHQLELQGLLMSNNEELQQLSSEQIFSHVLETATMSEYELSEYCRIQGLFVDQLEQWKKSCLNANKPDSEKQYKYVKEVRADKKRIKDLEKELNRKDRALAETAALLVLREKFNAAWKEKEEE